MKHSFDLANNLNRHFEKLARRTSWLGRKPVTKWGWSSGVPGVVPFASESQFTYFTSEGYLYGHRKHVADWLGEATGLEGTEYWTSQKKPLLRVMRQLYQPDSPAPAWVMVQCLRVLVMRRLEPLGFAITSVDPPRRLGPNGTLGGRPCIDAFGIRLPVDELEFEMPHGEDSPDVEWTRVMLRREFVDSSTMGGSLVEKEVRWCLTDEGDDQAISLLQAGKVQAGMPLVNEATRVNRAVMINFGKPWLNGRLARFTIEYHPDSGRCVSIRYGTGKPLAMSIAMDNEEADMLWESAELCL